MLSQISLSIRRTGSLSCACALTLSAVWVSSAAVAGVLFEDYGKLHIRLRAPLTTIYSERGQDERDEHAGTLSYAAVDGAQIQLDIDVRTRGNFRRRHCRLAPLRLHFNKKQVIGTLFEGESKLKLVSSCRGSRKYEDLVVSEYLVYRLYALLSEYHFRVRPMRVEFIDGDGKASPRTSFAFVIEDMHDMAARYARVVPEWEKTSFGNLDAAALAGLEIFQYMIGGHDWSAIAAAPGERCCHNLRLIVKPGETTAVIPVPYDFDITGVVNPPYASPPQSIPIKTVRQRYFRGRCKTDRLWRSTFEQFSAARKEIYGLYKEELAGNNRLRSKTLRYFDKFYNIIGDETRAGKLIVARCKGQARG